MRVLLISNEIGLPSLLGQYLSPHQVTIIGWDAIKDISIENFDFIVLSGSSNFPVFGHEYALQDELDVIRSSSIPVLGICYGFELIVRAFGGTLKRLPERERGVEEMEILSSDPILKNIDKLFVYESHKWTIDSLPSCLIPLAKSEHGIEAVKHENRLIYGFQFHPEKLLRETSGSTILKNFISLMK